MGIPLKEKVKLHDLVEKIEAGKFDANDVDNLLIKVRPYAPMGSVLREISHFVAHADARDQGIACDALTAYSDVMRYFMEYVSPQRTLEMSDPFPSYIFRLMKSQALRVNTQKLKNDFRMSHQSFVKKIDAAFVVDKQKRTCTVRPEKMGIELYEAISYSISCIYSRAAIDLSVVNAEILALFGAQNI